MKYRAEIDGLRAVAVIPVILFHAGFELFSGGFVGVDVFFVISGYLITTILIEDIENNRFSILNFYERRARRILPALFFVMLMCIPFAWMWMLPSQLKDFSQSLIAVSLFVSNILFWRETGYFADAAAEKPLLHTWSLAVEEQYYVLFPIFLFLVWRYRKNRVFWMIALCAAISLMLSEWGWRNSAPANFYLAPTRVWELFAGSLASFFVQRRGVRANNTLSIIGIAAILFAIFAYDRSTPFPSVYSLVPISGVVLLVLFADRKTIAAKILGNKLLVGIGLISYSVYLWHQPLIAFAKLRLRNDPSLLTMALLLSASFVLAYFSWRFVEQPFRKKGLIKRKPVFSMALTGILSFSLLGWFGYYNDGFESRLVLKPDDKVDRQTLEAILAEWPFSGYPKPDLEFSDPVTGLDRIGLNDSAKVLLVGDSHSYQYRNSYNEFFSNQENDTAKTRSVLFKHVVFPPKFNELPLDEDESIDTVVVSYFWALNYGSKEVNQYIRCCGEGPNGVVGKWLVDPKSEDEMNSLDETIRDFLSKIVSSGKQVFIVLDNPFGEELNAQSMIYFDGLLVRPTSMIKPLSRGEAIMRAEPVRSRLIKIAHECGVGIIDPFEYLCDEDICPAFSEDGYLMYKDYDHISYRAVLEKAKYIHSMLKQ